jgi:hypothetical protein
MANSFHLARTTKLRLALRARGRLITKAKLFSEKSSQENKILTDCSTDFFPDFAGKKEFFFEEQPEVC